MHWKHKTDAKFICIFVSSSKLDFGWVWFKNFRFRIWHNFDQFFLLLMHEGVSKSFRTGRLERELQMVQLTATMCSCIAILWVSLVSFAAITLCVATQWVFIVVLVIYFVTTQSGNFWIHPSKVKSLCLTKHHAMKTYGGVEVQLHAFLTSALHGG
jgi:hypothetical protein